MKYHVKKGDKVLVNSGNYKGEEATIKAVITKNDRVCLNSRRRKIARSASGRSKRAGSIRTAD